MNKQKTLKKLSKIFLEEYPKYYKSKLAFSVACDVDEKTIRRVLKWEQNVSIWVFLNYVMQ